MKTLKQFLTIETTIKIVMVLFIAFTLVSFIIELCKRPAGLVFGSF